MTSPIEIGDKKGSLCFGEAYVVDILALTHMLSVYIGTACQTIPMSTNNICLFDY